MSRVPNPQKTSRRAIVAAALETVERHGADALSMRAVARRLGLAPNALYNYFPDRKGLEAAMGAEGMRRLQAVLRRAAKQAPAADALRRCCRAYLRFARRRPALYGIAMRRHPDTPELLASRAGLRDFFRALFRSFQDPRAVQTAAFAAWALLHGMAVLDDADPSAASFSAMQTLIAALSQS
jgi:AcrR family transcriptional regulator